MSGFVDLSFVRLATIWQSACVSQNVRGNVFAQSKMRIINMARSQKAIETFLLLANRVSCASRGTFAFLSCASRGTLARLERILLF